MILILGLYVAALLVIAVAVELRGEWRWLRNLSYPLSLGVLSTAWSYFGAPGAAARYGWSFLGPFIGPIIGFTVFFPVWRKILFAVRRANSGSLADFLSSRYGKSRALGLLVTLVCTLGLLPHLAVQLTYLIGGWRAFHGTPSGGGDAMGIFAIAGVLGLFAMLFGARKADLTEQRRGLVQAVAIGSAVKLGSLIVIAVVAGAMLVQTSPQARSVLATSSLAVWPTDWLYFATATLLPGITLFCTPREFQMGFLEHPTPAALRLSRWLFPACTLAITLCVVPIAMAGLVFAPHSNPDFFGLDIARASNVPGLTQIVYLGGFSAAIAMVVVETVALSAMISNHLVLPLAAWARRGIGHGGQPSQRIVEVRRAAIFGVLILASLYELALPASQNLMSLSLSSYAMIAQLAPALIGGVFWRRANARGAFWGMLAGGAPWIILLVAPQLAGLFPDLALAPAINTPAGLTMYTAVSLVVNLTVFAGFSLLTRPSHADQVQADDIVGGAPARFHADVEITAGELESLVARFIGEERAARGFQIAARELGRDLTSSDSADPAMLKAAELMLGGAIGPAASRSVVAGALSRRDRSHDQAIRLLNHAAQFSREVLESTLENIDQGVSMVDSQLRHLAWNARYLEMFELPPDFTYVGQPIEEIHRFDISRHIQDPDEIEKEVNRRLEPIRRGVPYVRERTRPNGRIFKKVGMPMAGGGYVSSFSDITELRQAVAALRDANERLEARVEARTAELTEAKSVAEMATAAKSRFLAAASHDLLQPLHAARLFIGAIQEELPARSPARRLMHDADHCISTANRMLRALLSLSRLEAGGINPELTTFPVQELFDELDREFQPAAREKGLKLVFHPTGFHLVSDRDLVRSILQNLIANATLYTNSGGVLVGCRKAGDSIRLGVWDTGPGIAAEHLSLVVQEFVRLPGSTSVAGGMGLGLAIVKAVSQLLGHDLDIRSRLGKGSCFSILVPPGAIRPRPRRPSHLSGKRLPTLKVCCVDDNPAVLASMTELLGRWGMTVSAASGPETLRMEEGPWDIAIIDEHLDGPIRGSDMIRNLGGQARHYALITSELDEGLPALAQSIGATLIEKPVDPAVLKAFLARTLN